jgi:hypothetical protein
LEGFVGSVLGKFRVQGEDRVGPNLDLDRLFNEIEKEKDFIHKKGIIKKKPIAPKADLLAWYIDTTTSRCLRTYGA